MVKVKLNFFLRAKINKELGELEILGPPLIGGPLPK